MKRLIPILFLFAVLAGGCVQEGDEVVAPLSDLTGPACLPMGLIPEAAVRDNVAGDGLGSVTATDTTPGAAGWLWTLPGCTPSDSQRRTFTSTCPLNAAGLNWSLTVSDAGGCIYPTSGNTPIS